MIFEKLICKEFSYPPPLNFVLIINEKAFDLKINLISKEKVRKKFSPEQNKLKKQLLKWTMWNFVFFLLVNMEAKCCLLRNFFTFQLPQLREPGLSSICRGCKQPLGLLIKQFNKKMFLKNVINNIKSKTLKEISAASYK